MDVSPRAANSVVPPISKSGTQVSIERPSDDQYFLLYLIMGTYFGPDLYEENPRKCAFHRLHEARPSYTIQKLSNSHIKTFEIERIYYYILRKADNSVIVKQEWLHKFFHGNLPTPVNDIDSAYPQFPDLFPPQLHPHTQGKNDSKTIQNIVFIDNPLVYYFRTEIIDRFRRLTGLTEFTLDREEAMLHRCIVDKHLENQMEEESKANGNLVGAEEAISDDEMANDPSPLKDSLPDNNNNSWEKGNCYGKPMMYNKETPLPYEPGMILLPSPLTRDDWGNFSMSTKKGSVLTGTAVMGQMGPTVGLLDIGECEDSYLFRVSLPGVIRDEREFGCEVESDGKVLIRGVTTTGEKKVNRFAQEFEMKTRNLCPPGDFSISFHLPGPVDPQQFSGNFGTDGILEGIVIKATHSI